MVAVATFVFEAIVGAERAFATPGFIFYLTGSIPLDTYDFQEELTGSWQTGCIEGEMDKHSSEVS